jgi:hypothetical protein
MKKVVLVSYKLSVSKDRERAGLKRSLTGLVIKDFYLTRATDCYFEWLILFDVSHGQGLAASFRERIVRFLSYICRANSSGILSKSNKIDLFLSLLLSLRAKAENRGQRKENRAHIKSIHMTNAWAPGLSEFYFNDKAYAYRCYPNRRSSGGYDKWEPC